MKHVVMVCCDSRDCVNSSIRIVMDAINEEAAEVIAGEYAMSKEKCINCGKELLFFPYSYDHEIFE